MVNEEVLKQVMSAVLNVDPATIGPGSSMDNIKSWDSLQHMNLVLALEEEFRVTIPDEEAANLSSYALIKLVLEENMKVK
jgi:acyl carrier protein